MQSYTYTMCTCKSCKQKAPTLKKGNSLLEKSATMQSRKNAPILFSLREKKNPWSNQGESLTCWICLEEFSSKAYVYGPTLWWAYETKTSLAEYFQRHYKLNCFCFSFTKEFQQHHNNNFLFHTLYITYICIDTTLKSKALETLLR